MREGQPFISIGYYKGEMDFGVNTNISDLDHGQMRKLREMTVIAIGQAERMWASAQEEKTIKPSCKNKSNNLA